MGVDIFKLGCRIYYDNYSQDLVFPALKPCFDLLITGSLAWTWKVLVRMKGQGRQLYGRSPLQLQWPGEEAPVEEEIILGKLLRRGAFGMDPS
jgi:hypothetical protein